MAHRQIANAREAIKGGLRLLYEVTLPRHGGVMPASDVWIIEGLD